MANFLSNVSTIKKYVNKNAFSGKISLDSSNYVYTGY